MMRRFIQTVKKTLSGIVLGAFIFTISAAPAAASTNSDISENIPFDKEIFVNLQDGANLYEVASNATASNTSGILKATLDEKAGLYEVTSEENLYLQSLGDNTYLPLEKNEVNTISALHDVAEKYALTGTEITDAVSFLEKIANIKLSIYAPKAITEEGTYNGKKYRIITVCVTDNVSQYPIAQGRKNIMIDAVGILEKKANIGAVITNAVLGLLHMEYRFHNDATCFAEKDENTYFQYLDFYEVGSAYVTRGIASHGTICIKTKTTRWVKKSNGDFVNEPIIETPVNGRFGTTYSGYTLAARAFPYFEDYSGLHPSRYEDYTSHFKVGRFEKISAITPKGVW